MKYNHWLLLSFCCLFAPALKGQQQYQLVRSFPVPEQLTVSADKQGNILLSTPDGEIQKYNAEGKLLYTYSPSSASSFSTLDARFTMQVRAFDENNQQLVYLDRFLNLSGKIELSNQHFTFITALSWSASGNTIWVYDASDMQIKRWRTDTREIISTLKLNQLIKEPIEVKMLHEYQHKLYLLAADRLLVFDQLGSFDREILLPKWTAATFSEGELLYLTNEKDIEIIHLYTGSKRKIPFSTQADYQNMLARNGELFLFSKNAVDVYQSDP